MAPELRRVLDALPRLPDAERTRTLEALAALLETPGPGGDGDGQPAPAWVATLGPALAEVADSTDLAPLAALALTRAPAVMAQVGDEGRAALLAALGHSPLEPGVSEAIARVLRSPQTARPLRLRLLELTRGLPIPAQAEVLLSQPADVDATAMSATAARLGELPAGALRRAMDASAAASPLSSTVAPGDLVAQMLHVVADPDARPAIERLALRFLTGDARIAQVSTGALLSSLSGATAGQTFLFAPGAVLDQLVTRHKDGPIIVRALVGLARSPAGSAAFRRLTWVAVARLGTTEAVKALAIAIEDRAPSVWRPALAALGHLPPEGAVDRSSLIAAVERWCIGRRPRGGVAFRDGARAAIEALHQLTPENGLVGPRVRASVGAAMDEFSATRDLLLRREALPASLRPFARARADLDALEAMARATTTTDLMRAIAQAKREDRRPPSPGEDRWTGPHLTAVLEALLRARAAEAERRAPPAGQASRTAQHRMAAQPRARAGLMELLAFIGNPVSRADTPLVSSEEAWAGALARLKTEAMPPAAYQAVLRLVPATRRAELRAFSRARPDLFTFEQLDAIVGPWRCPPALCGEAAGVRLEPWREGLMPRDAAVKALQQITATVLRGSGKAPPSAMLWPNKRAVLALEGGGGGRILGFIHYDTSGVLDEVAVSPDAARRGLGDRLLRAAIADLRRLGHRSLAFNIAAADELQPGVASPLGFYEQFARRHPALRFRQGQRAVGMFPGSLSVIEF